MIPMGRRGFLAATGAVALAGCAGSDPNETPTPTEEPTPTDPGYATEPTDDVDLARTEVMRQATRIGVLVELHNGSPMGDRVFLRFAFYDSSGDVVRTEYEDLGSDGAMYGIGTTVTEETFWFDFEPGTTGDLTVDVRMVSEAEYKREVES